MKHSWILAVISIVLLIGLIVGVALYEESNKPVNVDRRPTAPSTQATQAPTETTQSEVDDKWEELLTYREYLDMTAEERNEFYASFEDPNEFYAWFNAVKAIYDEERKDNQIGNGGSIDMGDVDNAG